MVPEFRNRFNAEFTPEKHQRMLRSLEAECGVPIGFRICETPCFLPADLMNRLVETGSALTKQIVNDPGYFQIARGAIPEMYRVSNEDPRPLFVQVDFGLDQDLNPKLVEIQGFPSLYAFQPALAAAYRNTYNFHLSALLGGLDQDAYDSLLRRAILGGHDPENVILMEIEPERQKTLVDFRLTERLCGIKTVCITDVNTQGRRLFYSSGGRLIPVHRIYNRVIVDELIRSEIRPPFGFRDYLDVEWAGHPNWYFLLSKFSVPFLRHESVPKTVLLDQIDRLPEDLENWVLKPLFSFAGQGVHVGPTREVIEAVSDRSAYLLQERVDFRPVIDTPFGMTKAEIRVMYVWLDDLQPVTAIIRMGRGKMMGVDHNRDMEWVGASAAFVVDD